MMSYDYEKLPSVTQAMLSGDVENVFQHLSTVLGPASEYLLKYLFIDKCWKQGGVM